MRIFFNLYKINLYDIISTCYYIFISDHSMSKPIEGITLDRTLKWLDKTEGRDKFCKAIQYACRFLKHEAGINGHKEREKKYDALFGAMRDARKLFRLFKSLKQYGKLLQILMKRGSMKSTDFTLNVLTRVFFLLYWFFDNLSILSKLGLIKLDTKQMAKKGATCWFIALLATLILTIKNIIVNLGKISYLKKSVATSGTTQTNEKLSQAKQIQKSNSKEIFTLIKTVGDMLPAGQGCQFYSKFLGFNVSQRWCGIGGFVSAVLTSYELYQ